MLEVKLKSNVAKWTGEWRKGYPAILFRPYRIYSVDEDCLNTDKFDVVQKEQKTAVVETPMVIVPAEQKVEIVEKPKEETPKKVPEKKSEKGEVVPATDDPTTLKKKKCSQITNHKHMAQREQKCPECGFESYMSKVYKRGRLEGKE